MTAQPLAFRYPSWTFQITPAVRRVIDRYFLASAGVSRWGAQPGRLVAMDDIPIAIITRVRAYRGVRLPHLVVFLTRYLAAFRHTLQVIMMRGKSNKAICRVLNLAEPTVKKVYTTGAKKPKGACPM